MNQWRLRDVTDPALRERPYQTADIARLTEMLQTSSSAFALHEQGLGKSRIALRVAANLRARRILILVPSIAMISWREELRKWTDAMFQLIKSSADVKRLRTDVSFTAVTYDLCRSEIVRRWLAEWAAEFAIMDEAQYCRSVSAARTQAIYNMTDGVLRATPRTLIMSGTIVVSWPMDLWTHLSRWRPELIVNEIGNVMGADEFKHRYHVVVQSDYGEKILRVRNNIDELRQRFAPAAIRRRKDDPDVAPDLPSMTWRLEPLEMTAKMRSAVMDTMLEQGVPYEEISALESMGDTPDDQRRMMEMLERSPHTSVINRVLGLAKAPLICDLLRAELAESDYAVGIGFWNIAVGDVIDAQLQNFGVVRIDGSTSLNARQRAVDAFRRENGPRVFNGQLQACATALTLVRASRVILTQASITPGDNKQFAARFHRIGQSCPVEVRVPYIEQSFDEGIQRVLTRKSDAAAAVIEAA